MTEIANPLGRKVVAPNGVDASVLFPIARAQARTRLGVMANALPFGGADLWNAWELSWLDPRGRPRAAVAELRVPCTSPNLVESKSLKLYLNGYAMTRFAGADAVRDRIALDVATCVGMFVGVSLVDPAELARLQTVPPAGESLDDEQTDIDDYASADPAFLVFRRDAPAADETLFTRAFRSLCPVTGQPDWARIEIAYRGPRIDHAGLLRYLVSFRSHPDFHEACVERIFCDIQRRCHPAALRVHGRFLRRGGVDINPWRASAGFAAPANARTARQ